MKNSLKRDVKVKTSPFIQSKEEYFKVLLDYYCKKRHKRSKNKVMCHYCEDFFYEFKELEFDANNLNTKYKNKYNRVLNCQNVFFMLRHIFGYIKYHKLFEVVYVSNNE